MYLLFSLMSGMPADSFSRSDRISIRTAFWLVLNLSNTPAGVTKPANPLNTAPSNENIPGSARTPTPTPAAYSANVRGGVVVTKSTADVTNGLVALTAFDAPCTMSGLTPASCTSFPTCGPVSESFEDKDDASGFPYDSIASLIMGDTDFVVFSTTGATLEATSPTALAPLSVTSKACFNNPAVSCRADTAPSTVASIVSWADARTITGLLVLGFTRVNLAGATRE
mmetsp:Transcript_11197/g.22369  ORF Transcript_11197/g.22369 Transcript_11197/m.22369 type:complete len:226 (+) Transcript_11197:1821-2498(+)